MKKLEEGFTLWNARRRRAVRQLADDSTGFTLAELIVVIVLTTLFSGLIITFTFDFWRYGYSLESDLETLTTRLNAGDILREQIGSSSGLIIQNSLADSHVLVADPSQSSGTYWAPIHAVPGNKPVGASGTYTPLIYYKRYSQSSNGSFIMNGSQPYEDEYVLYMDGSARTLKLRALANPNAAGNRLKTTCPPNLASASCPADKTVVSDLSSINTRYFSRTGNLIDYTSITDPDTGAYIGPDFPVVEVVELTINIAAKPTLQSTNTTINSTIIRVALRNS